MILNDFGKSWKGKRTTAEGRNLINHLVLIKPGKHGDNPPTNRQISEPTAAGRGWNQNHLSKIVKLGNVDTIKEAASEHNSSHVIAFHFMPRRNLKQAKNIPKG